MADVVVGAFVDTEEVLPDEKVVDMDPTMRRLDPDQTQFTTMTSRMPSRASTREKFNWLEEQYVNNLFTVAAAGYASGATAIPVGATDTNSIQPNDILRNMRTGEAMLVTAIPSAGNLTVRATRLGSAAAAAGTSGDKLVFIGSAFPQGSSYPQPKYSRRVLGYNYTQTFRTSWVFSGTATSIELYGGREPAKEAARKAVEHKRELEHNGFFGARDFFTITDPQGTSGGLIEFIVTNKQNVGGELTSDFLDLFLATVLAKGSSDKVIFTGTQGAYYISRFHRSGQGAFWQPQPQTIHGVRVDGVISGVFGYQVPVVVKKEWSNYPTGASGYNGNLFVIDMTNVERRPLRDRDTALLTARQNPGDDKVAAEYLTEMGWEVAQERTHGLLTGIA